ncbi:hypothetical protein AAF712_010139 [Marasmius tenuissimus]|uniref:Uncharacterized protein n=1 Tax=Marasmius tenuissimus TaxID=585030 RepID=A0ABR2ZNL7_9AGAR
MPASHWNAPKLKEATFWICDAHSYALQSAITPSAGQLEAFLGSVVNTQVFSTPAFQNLRYLFAYFEPTASHVLITHCTLPQLQHLEINTEKARKVARILDSLTAPKLDTLELTWEMHGRNEGWEDEILLSIVELQERSGCSLEVLRAPAPIFSGSDVVALTQRLPAIRELHIEICDLTPEEDRRGLFVLGRTDVFPRVSALHFVFVADPEPGSETLESFASIADLAESRRSLSGEGGLAVLNEVSLSLEQFGQNDDGERPAPRYLSTNLEPLQRILTLGESGLALHGRVVGETWRSSYMRVDRWCGGLTRIEHRCAKFGYSDWLWENTFLVFDHDA